VSLQPDVADAIRYIGALFPEQGLVHLRAVAEPRDGRPATNHHYQLDSSFADTIEGFLDYCAAESRAAYILPGYVKAGGTHKDAVDKLWSILVDLDKGDTTAALAQLEEAIGPATVIVESGGTTDTGQKKLHAYWKLTEEATGAEIDRVCRVRENLALRFGGDTSFKQQGQVIRIPGSYHLKGEPKLVRLRTVRPGQTYSLDHIAAVVGEHAIAPTAAPIGSFLDFSNVVPFHSDVDRVMTSPIHAEGADDLTRFEGASIALGHYIRQIREGRMTEEEAWQAVREWNQATLIPPWPEDRLRHDWRRLREIDTEANGPIVPKRATLPVQADSDWSIEQWGLERYAGPIPERQWLVDGLIPLGTAGVFAAPGDAGKSMLALQLAHTVAQAPAPQNTRTSPAGVSDTPRFFGQPITSRGSAVMLTAEDDYEEVKRRISSIAGGNYAPVDGRKFRVVPMPSAGGARAIMTSSPATGPQLTPFWEKLREELLAIPDLKLIVIDPLSSFVAANLDSDNMAGAALMAALGALAAQTGATVMVLHHFAKGAGAKITSLSDARNAIRGASSLVDNSRWALTMWEVDDNEAATALKALGRASTGTGVVYAGGLAKSNAPAEKSRRVLVRDPTTGILQDQTEALRRAAPRQDETDQRLFEALKQKQAADTGWSFTSGSSILNDEWGPTIRQLGLNITKEGKGKGSESMRAVFDRWLDRGWIVRTQDRKPRYQIALDAAI
jgi:hypothetical protein